MRSDLSDSELMERVGEGDVLAFRALVARHLPRAHAIAGRVLSSPQDTEEAVQDAFTRVWTHAARYDPERAAFGTWLYRILTNACLDLARRRPRAHIEVETVQDTLADTAEGQEAQAVSRQAGERVRQAVMTLPERQRMAVALCYFSDLTNPEAARAMGLHIKALEGLLVRARKKLRQLLDDVP